MAPKKKSAKKPKKATPAAKPKKVKRVEKRKGEPKKVKRVEKRKGEPKRMGRPSKFTEDMANRIFALAATGMTDDRIAAAVRVNEATLTNWKKQYPDFFTSLKRAKEIADEMVEGSLLRRAQGYSHPAIKIHFNKFGIATIHEYTEHYPPSEAAAIFWLKNRKKKEWKDMQARELSGPNGEALTMIPPQIIVTLPANGREAPEEKKPEETE